MPKQTPPNNSELRRIFRETGWTLRQLAQEVNRIGTEQGTPYRYQAPSAHQWLAGHMPKSEVQSLIVEAFSRRLGRPISHAQAGFRSLLEKSSNISNTVDELVDLGREDMDPSRRGVIGASLFSIGLSVPNWPDVAGRVDAFKESDTRRISMADVDAVSVVTDRLSEFYDQFGGCHARPMAAAFMVNNVAPYLRADGSSEVRKSMVSAASLLCYLTGWMAVDEGLHGLAQRYYIQALKFAGRGEDHMTYCRILRGMSVQAVDLGHGAPALRLANAAAEASPGAGPRMRAFFSGQQAHAYAVAGDRPNALRSIQETEKALDIAESQSGTVSGYSPSTLAYSIAQVRYGLGDVIGSVESLKLHFRLRDPGDSRGSGIRFNSMLAERQLEIGHLETACETWHQALDDYPMVQSGRVDECMKVMASRLQPYLKNKKARGLYERARTVTPKAFSV